MQTQTQDTLISVLCHGDIAFITHQERADDCLQVFLKGKQEVGFQEGWSRRARRALRN